MSGKNYETPSIVDLGSVQELTQQHGHHKTGNASDVIMHTCHGPAPTVTSVST